MASSFRYLLHSQSPHSILSIPRTTTTLTISLQTLSFPLLLPDIYIYTHTHTHIKPSENLKTGTVFVSFGNTVTFSYFAFIRARCPLPLRLVSLPPCFPSELRATKRIQRETRDSGSTRPLTHSSLLHPFENLCKACHTFSSIREVKRKHIRTYLLRAIIYIEKTKRTQLGY